MTAEPTDPTTEALVEAWDAQNDIHDPEASAEAGCALASRTRALLEEVERLRADRDYMVINAEGLSRSGGRLKAERDALQAKINQALADHKHADTCDSMLGEYACDCWRSILSEPEAPNPTSE